MKNLDPSTLRGTQFAISGLREYITVHQVSLLLKVLSVKVSEMC
jgi:hypothetical protein